MNLSTKEKIAIFVFALIFATGCKAAPTRQFVEPIAESPQPKLAEKSCNRCHGDFEKSATEFLPAGGDRGMRFSHKAHRLVKVACEVCHHEGHKTDPLPKPEDCYGCHPYELPHPLDWKESHGKGKTAFDLVPCYPCHTADDCIRCHGGLTMPHPANFRKIHPAALAKYPTSCDNCHTRDFCINCHKIPMPHPADFPAQHGKLALTDRGVCANCHEEEKICWDCHKLEMPHPKTFLVAHNGLTKKVGEDACDRCHYREDCNACHQAHKGHGK
ncbi:MAG: hypothetical protein QMD08_02240 [Actinomycetota bacterium]|nr:hypothetical protein [Actinomycetota bacterium]